MHVYGLESSLVCVDEFCFMYLYMMSCFGKKKKEHGELLKNMQFDPPFF
jgi:hypothetical protein